MSWNDIPKWQAMTKDELIKEGITEEPELEKFKDRIYWVYIDNRYNLSFSMNQKYPDRVHLMLWAKGGETEKWRLRNIFK